MAIHTPLLSPTVSLPAEDRNTTAPLDLTLELRRDALSLLDHRTRRRAVPRLRALPGQYLELQDGEGVPHLIPLEATVMHIGRSVNADVRFEDPHVSRRHAIIVRYGRHVRALDDRSSAGTYVNGLRIIATDLLPDDVVRLGPIALTYTVIR